MTTWFQKQATAYRDGQDRPLAGYLGLMAVYGLGTAAVAGAARGLGKPFPERLRPWDVVQLSLATHKISRTLAKDPVTSPLRAPFTTYRGLSAAAELREEVRGHGLQHSVGELLTCPLCLAQWVATGLVLGYAVAPATTRVAVSVMSTVAGADLLQYLYAMAQQAADGG